MGTLSCCFDQNIFYFPMNFTIWHSFHQMRFRKPVFPTMSLDTAFVRRKDITYFEQRQPIRTGEYYEIELHLFPALLCGDAMKLRELNERCGIEAATQRRLYLRIGFTTYFIFRLSNSSLHKTNGGNKEAHLCVSDDDSLFLQL